MRSAPPPASEGRKIASGVPYINHPEAALIRSILRQKSPQDRDRADRPHQACSGRAEFNILGMGGAPLGVGRACHFGTAASAPWPWFRQTEALAGTIIDARLNDARPSAAPCRCLLNTLINPREEGYRILFSLFFVNFATPAPVGLCGPVWAL
jgi:hypothetical protein